MNHINNCIVEQVSNKKNEGGNTAEYFFFASMEYI